MNNKSQLESVIGELKGQNSRDLEAQRAAIDKQIVDMIMQQTAMNVEDIVKGLSKRKKTAKESPVAPNTANKVVNVNANFYADALSASKPKLRTGGNSADIGEKIYAVMKQDIDERKLRSELSKNKEEEQFEEDKRRHQELIKAINKAKEKPAKPEVKKGAQPRDEKGRFIKKEPAQAKAETPPPAAKPAPTPTPAPAAKPAPAPAPAPAPSAAPSAAKAPTPAPAPPAATKAPIVEAPPKIPTAVKAAAVAVAVGVAGYELAKNTILKHEGFKTRPYKDSKGLWTVGVGHLIGDGKSLPKEYDREFSKEEIQALYEEDFKEHKKAAEKIPGYNNLNEKGQTALIDLTFNMGPSWYKKWPMLVKQLEAGDIEGAAKNLEGSDWYKQVKSRGPEVVALLRQGKKDSTSTVAEPLIPGSKVNSDSVENKDLKSSTKSTNVAIDNTKTNIISSGGSAPQTIRTPTPSERPAIIGG